MAWSKIVGFDVRPVTESSATYFCSVPLSSRWRVMLSSQRLWPRVWSFCVPFMASPREGLFRNVGAERRVHDRLGFPQDRVQVGRVAKALRVDLVDVLGARRPRREPPRRGRDLEPAD